MSPNTLMVLNQKLVPFRVHVIRQGDKCGLGGREIHDEVQPLVEFHEIGSLDSAASSQFVAHYRMNTLLSVEGGLALRFHEPRWHVDAAAMTIVLRWLALQGFEQQGVLAPSSLPVVQLKKT